MIQDFSLTLHMQHILSAHQFDKKGLLQIISDAKKMAEILENGGNDMARGKILATLFYEPSTRTRLSFETAMHRLGGSVISETDVHFSSQTKGEMLSDTAKIVGGYADIIAIRSKNTGDAQIVADSARVPVINGGDGSAEHPTQSLLDLYTIAEYFDLEKPLKIVFVGDLKYGRTIHSLVTLLQNFPRTSYTFVAPEVIQIPKKYVTDDDIVTTNLTNEILETADVIYDTRIQRERFEDPAQYEQVKNAFIFSAEKVQRMEPNAILMHPLPRVNEIAHEVDALPQAKYFEQAQNGVPVRMALIARCLNLL